jgi:hypothetical protein
VAEPEKQTDKSAKEKFLAQAKERFNLAAEAEDEQRRLALDDLTFLSGQQWPLEVRQARDLDHRPCLTINRLPQYSRQIINEVRQNRPSIKVNPVDDKADLDTAKIFQGIVRHIEYASHADVAYDTGFEACVNKGLGYWRVVTAFCDPMSFDQDIYIKRIRDSFTVYLDPHSQEPDGSDTNWGFVFDEMSADDFKAQYPNAELSHMEDWTSLGDTSRNWVQKDSVRVAEYFYKTFKEVELALLGDRSVVPVDQVKDGMVVVSTRKTTLPAIKWAKINGIEVLEETDWPGQWIPIIPVIGNELIVDGKRILEGIIRHAKDPQRMYNYWASAETETIALAPRAPFIGVEGQFKGHPEWKTANTMNHAYLEYAPVSIGGSPAPPPQRNVYEAPTQAITQARVQSADDLKSTTGMYDATFGNRSNEQSGRAIERRNQQAQTTNYHFVDNLSRAIRHTGRIIIDLIPKIYDAPRAARIIGEDGEVDIVRVNEIFQEAGQNKIYDLSKGTYDVTVSTGPSYETKRQEASATMLDFQKALPPPQQGVISDLIARNMDWSGAELIAERLKKSLPPGIAEQDDKDKQPLPPQVQQQMMQMNQTIEQLTQALNAAHNTMDTKKLELDSRERIEAARIQAQLTIAEIQAHSKESIVGFQQEVLNVHKRLDMLHASNQLQQNQNQFEQSQQALEAEPPQGQNENPAGGSPAQPVE